MSLVASVAFGSTGHIAAITVATIVARDLTGSTVWSGAPGAAVVLGAATGLGSGFVVAGAGYATLGIMGAAMVLIPGWLLLRRNLALRTAVS